MNVSSIAKKNNNMINLFQYKKPNIVVIGGKDIHFKLKQLEKDLHLRLLFTKIENLSNAVNGNTMAIIVDDEKNSNETLQTLKSIVQSYKLIPVFFLAKEKRRNNFYSELYEYGLESVINWPEESSLLKDLIIEVLKPHPLAIGETNGDKKLSEVVKSHLLVMGDFKNIRVKVINGFVFLKGKLKNLYDKKQVFEKSSNVLGVKQVISKDLKVENQKIISDKEISRRISLFANNYLKNNKSLIIRVKNRKVSLMGTLQSQGSANAIERFAMKQSGVKIVLNNIEINKKASQKTNKKARILERRISHLFNGIKHISLRIYGDYVEARGIVRNKAERALVEDYLFQVLPVKRVINKIHASSH